jgi:hypothetical protein
MTVLSLDIFSGIQGSTTPSNPFTPSRVIQNLLLQAGLSTVVGSVLLLSVIELAIRGRLGRSKSVPNLDSRRIARTDSLQKELEPESVLGLLDLGALVEQMFYTYSMFWSGCLKDRTNRVLCDVVDRERDLTMDRLQHHPPEV